jgi:hypothetical protein
MLAIKMLKWPQMAAYYPCTKCRETVNLYRDAVSQQENSEAFNSLLLTGAHIFRRKFFTGVQRFLEWRFAEEKACLLLELYIQLTEWMWCMHSSRIYSAS